MGVCESTKKPKKTDQTSQNEQNKNENFSEKTNENSIIKDKKNITIVKLIGQIKGDSLKIENNNNCVIMIMDYSSSCQIQQCYNCSIFIAPCHNSIIIRDCNNINLISISQQIRITNVNEGKFFIFSSTRPTIENSNVFLGMCFLQYMELNDLLNNCNLNVWNNKWSLYQTFGKNNDIKYADDKIKNEVVKCFQTGLNECYISVDQFQILPFTYGKSIEFQNKNNVLMCTKRDEYSEGDVLKLILPEELNELDIKLISTKTIEIKSEIYKDFVNRVKNGKNQNNIDYFTKTNNNNNYSRQNSKKFKKTYSLKNYNNKIENEYLFLWFILEDNETENIKEYIENSLEQGTFALVKSSDFEMDNNSFIQYLTNLFNFVV
jgi:protein XRP2